MVPGAMAAASPRNLRDMQNLRRRPGHMGSGRARNLFSKPFREFLRTLTSEGDPLRVPIQSTAPARPYLSQPQDNLC